MGAGANAKTLVAARGPAMMQSDMHIAQFTSMPPLAPSDSPGVQPRGASSSAPVQGNQAVARPRTNVTAHCVTSIPACSADTCMWRKPSETAGLRSNDKSSALQTAYHREFYAN